MNPEVNLLDKFIKKEYPFVLEVLGYDVTTYRGDTDGRLCIDIKVSSSHFCELYLDEDIELKVKQHMSSKLSPMIRAVISEWNGNGWLSFRFFPQDMGENNSVLKYLT